MAPARMEQFAERLLVRNTGITLVHVLNGIHEIDKNLATLVLKYTEQMVRRNWRVRLLYLMRTPGEDMRLQWTFWNLLNIAGIAEEHILGEHIVIRDIQEYEGQDKVQRIHSLYEQESQRMSRPLRIICVCTGNVDRSPLVEAYLRHELIQLGLADAISVESRGTLPREGLRASPPTEAIAAEMGIDLSSHRAQKLTRQQVNSADLILAMKEKHLRAIVKLDPSATERTIMLNIDDPAQELYLWEDTERYRDVLMQVKNATSALLADMAAKSEQIRTNLQVGGFQKRLAILDAFDEQQRLVKTLENNALLIADNVLWERGRLVQPSFMPQQAMGIITLALLASVGQQSFSQMVTRHDGVFIFNRVPHLTPP